MAKKDGTPTCSEENKQKIMDEFFNNGMQMAKAVQKVMPGYSYNSASVLGSHIKKEYKKEIMQRQAEAQDAWFEHHIVTVTQRKQFLSKIIMSSSDIPVSDKLKAVKILNEMDGLTGGVQSLTQVNINVPMEDKRNIVEAEVHELLTGGQDDSTGQGT